MTVTCRQPLDEADPAAQRARVVSVIVPPEHQGVVNALRACYPAERDALPADLLSLLGRLA